MERILVLEDTDSLREVLCTVLQCEGYAVLGSATAEEAIEKLKQENFSMVLSDLKLPGKSGIDFLREAKEINKSVPVLVMTAYGSIDIAVDAMKLGAVDFISKPFDPEMLVSLIKQVIQHKRIIDRSIGNSLKRPRKFITQNHLAEVVLHQARKVAALSSPVLLLGESGTGKELIARYIHEQSPRNSNPFVAVNCGSTPGELLESEFFGHEAGSFTGATDQRIGLFEIAQYGSIFLDEIGNMPLALQTKLLRVLQEYEIKRLGSTKIQKIDTRVISATNADLQQAIKNSTFRDDLFYRLSVVTIEIPALRDRQEDIELLANYFTKCLASEMSRDVPILSPETIKLLETYDWPGNARQLENVIERALIFHNTNILTPDCIELESIPSSTRAIQQKSLSEISTEASAKAEIEAISKALATSGGNKSKAARILDVSYKTLLKKVKEYQLGEDTEEETQEPINC